MYQPALAYVMAMAAKDRFVANVETLANRLRS
jgi:hypothetical protein